VLLQHVLEVAELLDGAWVDGAQVRLFFRERGMRTISVERVREKDGETDFVQLRICGHRGISRGGDAPTLGIVGRLGGIGARPEEVGLVSDADGAITALAAALKLLMLQRRGDILPGDVVVSTHICPEAPVISGDPVSFMGSPVDLKQMNHREVHEDMDALLSIDTTKGNRVLNRNGFAITPTVKAGYILPPANDLVGIVERTTGQPAAVLPLAQQDITPQGSGLSRINSMMLPSVATDAPTVGVGITSELPVPGSATGASREVDIAAAAQFTVEVAKAFSRRRCRFFCAGEYKHLVRLYGSMSRFQTTGRETK